MISEEPPSGVLFERGAAERQFTATPLAAGPHSPDLVAGGALCALAAMVVDEHCAESGALTGMRVARLSADFLAPAHRAGIDVQCTPVKVSRRVALHRVEMYDADKLVCRVELLHLGSTDGPAGARDWPAPEYDEAALEATAPITPWNGGFFGGAAEVRADGFNGVGVSSAYLRMHTPVVEDYQLDSTLAAVAAADNLHGMGRVSASREIATVNPDLVATVARDTSPGWARADIQQTWPGDGTGLSVATLSDRSGAFAFITQTQVVT